MAFSPKQRVTAWIGMAVLAGMALYPPWFWVGDATELGTLQYNGAGHAWLWSPPPSPPECDWHPVIWWEQLRDQCFVVAIGMLLLLFLREARERVPVPAPASRTGPPTS